MIAVCPTLAPSGSTTRCGSPSMRPVGPIGCTTRIREPFMVSCLAGATAVPRTMASCISDDPQRVDERASTEPCESERAGDSFTGRGCNAERQEAFAARAERRHAGPVFDEQGGVEFAAHLGERDDVVRMHDRRVAIAVLVFLGEADAFVDVLDAHEGNERHHLFVIDEWAFLAGFAVKK